MPALGHEYFRWYLFGHLFSVVGGWMQDASLRWYVQLSTAHVGSERWLGWTAAVAALPIVLLSPLGGAIADRWPRRRVIAATQSVDLVIAICLGILVWFDQLPLWGVLIFAAAHGSFLAFDIPARQAFVIEMVGPRDLMSAIGLNSTIFNLGRLLGPMAAGVVMFTAAFVLRPDSAEAIAESSRRAIAICFLINAASFTGLIALLLTRKPPGTSAFEGNPAPITTTPGPSRMLDGFREVWARPRAKGMLFTLALFLLAGGSYTTLLPAYADYVLNAGDQGYSLILTANGLGSVVGAVLVASLHRMESRRLPILAGLSLVAVGLILGSFCRTMPTACVSLFIVGIGFILFLASANATIQLGVPDRVRGRVMSIWVLVFGLGMPAGSLLAGQLAAWVGTSTVLFWQGFGTVPALLWCRWVLRDDGR